MRTTLTIDDDLLAAAKSQAHARSVPVGVVISEWARRGLSSGMQYPRKKGFPVFMVRENAKPITLEDVKRAEDEL